MAIRFWVRIIISPSSGIKLQVQFPFILMKGKFF